MSAAEEALRAVDVERIGRVILREGTSDKDVLEQIFFTEEFNFSTAPQFAWVRATYEAQLAVGETPLIIDCGANIGLSALYYAHHLPKARIVGIEPDAGNVALARRNTAHLPLVEIIEAAVHDVPGTLEIANPDAAKFAFITREVAAGAAPGAGGGTGGGRLDGGGSSSGAGSAGGGRIEDGERARGVATQGSGESGAVRVPAVTIDGLMERHGAKSVLIVKVDIEGAEATMFRSNTRWLDRCRLLTVETHDWLFPGQRTSRSLFKAVEGRDFEVIHKGEYISFFFG